MAQAPVAAAGHRLPITIIAPTNFLPEEKGAYTQERLLAGPQRLWYQAIATRITATQSEQTVRGNVCFFLPQWLPAVGPEHLLP